MTARKVPSAMSFVMTRRRAGLLGLLLGDAFGVPYEFHPPLAVDAVQMPPPGGFARSHRAAPAFAWSDDGARALALVDALTAPEGHAVAFPKNLVRWFVEGSYAVEGRVYDVGSHTSRVLNALAAGRTATAQDFARRADALGNGSLMGTLPCALLAATDGEAVLLARETSAVTHAATTCVEACALYCCVARALLDHKRGADAWEHGVARYKVLGGGIDPSALFVADADARQATGFVLHGLNLARIALQHDYGWERGVRETIALGGDTDTNAAIVGGLLALQDGELPAALLARLPKPDWMMRLVERVT